MAPDRQTGTYWLGASFGALATLLTVLAFERLTVEPEPSAVLMPKDVIQAYNQGISDALKTNPPSLELEQVCMNMWAERQPVKD